MTIFCVYYIFYSFKISPHIMKSEGLFTWRWGTPGRRGNPSVYIISHFNLITFTC